MAKLRELEKVVTYVLENNPETRKDDFNLIYEVYARLQPTIENISFKTTMLCHKQLKLPSLESITRCRRKVQEGNPDLRDFDAVETRIIEQGKYRNYALNLE